jgi:hypothetical protein
MFSFNYKDEINSINLIFESFSEEDKLNFYKKIVFSPEEFIYSLWEGINVIGSETNVKHDYLLLEHIIPNYELPKELILVFFKLDQYKKDSTEIYIEEIKNFLIKSYKLQQLDIIKNQNNINSYNTFYNASVIFLKDYTN